MDKGEQLLRELCIEIALGRIGGERFNNLLIATGIYLDEQEWDMANRLLSRSAPLLNFVEETLPAC